MADLLTPPPLTKSNSIITDSKTVQKFVFTGGPCGGKTTSLERVRAFLGQYGIRVYIVPEAATMMWTSGIAPTDMKNGDDWVNFQATLMRLQFHLEDLFYTMAERTGEQSVILCDRGAMDGKAYVDDETWDKIMDKNGVQQMDICDSRYNAVFHLVTAAKGAESNYSDETNSTRRESAEEARVLDQNILKAWMSHPKQIVFGNSNTTFEQKMSKLILRICDFCGLPSTRRKARKFLLNCNSSDKIPEDVHSEIFEIEKVYPMQASENDKRGYTFVRKRTKLNIAGKDKTKKITSNSYGFTRVRIDNSTGEKIEVKRILTGREYSQFCENKDPVRCVVRQHRISFIDKEHTCYICKYLSPEKVKGLEILYVQTSHGTDSDELNLPAWLDVDKEITGEAEYSSYEISLK
jgi:hypothetical protein